MQTRRHGHKPKFKVGYSSTRKTGSFAKGPGTINDNLCTILVNRYRSGRALTFSGRVERSCVTGRVAAPRRGGTARRHCLLIDVVLFADALRVAPNLFRKR